MKHNICIFSLLYFVKVKYGIDAMNHVFLSELSDQKKVIQFYHLEW